VVAGEAPGAGDVVMEPCGMLQLLSKFLSSEGKHREDAERLVPCERGG
jgi:hypothetical protein